MVDGIVDNPRETARRATTHRTTDAARTTTDPARPEVDLSRPEVDPARPEVDPARPEVDSARPKVDPARPGSKAAVSQTDTPRPTRETARAKTNPARAKANPARAATNPARPRTGARRAKADPARPEDRLREAIVSGRFQPSERLVEADLSRWLGVGRAAVRTALARLEHEGLIEHERHRGARVRLVGIEEAVEILEARTVLEALVARHAAVRATSGNVEELKRILAEMQRRLEAGDLLGASEQNGVLHRRLLEISGHSATTRLIATLKSQLVRFQYRTILVPGRSTRSLGEHTAIVEAVAAGDPDAAERAMRTHLTHVTDALRGETASPRPTEALRGETGSPRPTEALRAETASPRPTEALRGGTGSPQPARGKAT